MRHVLGTIVLVLAVLTTGCKSSVEAMCDKSRECDLLKNETFEQCVAQADKDLADLREQGAPCTTMADARESALDCVASLSCADFKDPEKVLKKCGKVGKALDEVEREHWYDCYPVDE